MQRQRRRTTQDRSAASHTPYFDFEEPAPPPSLHLTTDVRGRIRAACQEWVDRGNLVVQGGWGIETRKVNRDEYGHLTGTYEAVGERCCPFGLILAGRESHCMPLLDAMKVLGVDEFWAVGFIHGFDKANVVLIGRNLEKFMESESYRQGRGVGSELAGLFVRDEPV